MAQKVNAAEKLSFTFSQTHREYNNSSVSPSIQILRERFILNNGLQHELNYQINLAKKQLQNRAENLSINYTEKISINYLHQGRNNWQLKFTFGGIILNTSEPIILSTERVFSLKQIFEKTKLIEIDGKIYQTTGSMIQLGPILHQVL